MPELFLASTVIQDIVAKSFYAILTSDPSRAEKIARINGVEIDPDMMKEVKDSAFDALANILKYLPMQDQDRKAELLRKVEGAKNGQKENPHETAAALAMELGVEFPMVRELLADAQDCRNNYGALIINTLDQYQGVDGSKRKELDSDLACLFREEMQVPEVINNLSTRTQITPQKPVNLAFRDNPGDKFQALTIQNPALIY
jgi:hypothetical protein